MKSTCYIVLILLLAMAAGCRREKTIAEQMDEKFTVCYRAISNGDTAWLTVDTSKKQILGYFKINYVSQKKIYDGQIKGYIHGDTLKGHYDFKVNKVDKWYRNPVAFLKHRGNLTMGVGEIAMVWGSAYFDEKVPVDYTKGRFVFEEGDCVKSP
ncbi:MAG: hypothetical protein REI78_09720 [Pedobacter sp.]|nr:hypothetical protein [Pedobacter sp.]MDQ8053293.1 hypothetical protein [Pedobacter sp.]